MSEGKIVSISGGPHIPLPSEGVPNKSIIAALELLLERAKSGQLQSIVGTGFNADGLPWDIFGGWHPNIYEMLGAIEMLKDEYKQRLYSGVASLETSPDPEAS